MIDLISRSAVLEIIDEAIKNSFDFLQHETQIDIRFKVEELPTVEAKPVVHGEWVLDKRKDRIYCNHCNNYTLYEWNETAHEVSELISNFCPNCGAMMSDMRGEKNE